MLILAAVLLFLLVIEWLKGNIFVESINYIDATTLMMVGVLLVRGVVKQRNDTDLQAVSIGLIAALSFVFAFEAFYKLSFYVLPIFMPADELREFTIQLGTALTGLAGFAFGKFVFSKKSKLFLTLFLFEWAFWLSIGFPQLFTTQLFYPVIISLHLEWGTIYFLNRAAKFTLFLVYYNFFDSE